MQKSWEESWGQLGISKVITCGREVDGPPSSIYENMKVFTIRYLIDW